MGDDTYAGMNIDGATSGWETRKPKTEMLITKVAGVTFEGRQEWLALMNIETPIKIVPEPENQYDKNALAVHASIEGHGVKHVGFIPKNLAAMIAPRLEGEGVMAEVREVTGGFEQFGGRRASLGLMIAVEIPLPEGIITPDNVPADYDHNRFDKLDRGYKLPQDSGVDFASGPDRTIKTRLHNVDEEYDDETEVNPGFPPEPDVARNGDYSDLIEDFPKGWVKDNTPEIIANSSIAGLSPFGSEQEASHAPDDNGDDGDDHGVEHELGYWSDL